MWCKRKSGVVFANPAPTIILFPKISSSARIPQSISKRGGAITIGWRILMTRAVVGNRATSGIDQRPMYAQSWRPATDGTINRSLPPATDRTSNRGILWPIVRSIMALEDRLYDHSWGATIDRTINRIIVRPIVRSNVATYDRSYDQSWHQTIWNRSLDILNMTIVLATTDFAVAITHDLCDQSYVLSKMCPRFQHFRLQVGPRS